MEPARAGAGHLSGEFVHHLRIRQGVCFRELEQMRHPHRREAIRFDRLQVPAAAFDVKDLFLFAEDIAFHDLDRSIAAAMQHKRRVPSQQPGGVNSLLEVGLAFIRLDGVPKIVHRAWVD